MSSIDGWLATKYAILGKQANAQDIQARATASLHEAEAAAIPGKMALQGQDIAGQNQLRSAQARGADVTASLAPGQALAEQRLRGAQAGYYDSESLAKSAEAAYLTTPNADVTRFRGASYAYPNDPRAAFNATFSQPGSSLTPTTSNVITPGGSRIIGNIGATTAGAGGIASQPLGGGLSGYTDDDLARNRRNVAAKGSGMFAAGTSRVKGKGGPTDDKVDAKLSAGEAVLNAAAAEHLGRGTIDLLNAVGQAKMGLATTPTQEAEKAAQGRETGAPAYAAGTSKVPPKKSAAATAKAKPKGPGMKAAPGKPTKTPPAGQTPAITPEIMQAILAMGQRHPQAA